MRRTCPVSPASNRRTKGVCALQTGRLTAPTAAVLGMHDTWYWLHGVRFNDSTVCSNGSASVRLGGTQLRSMTASLACVYLFGIILVSHSVLLEAPTSGLLAAPPGLSASPAPAALASTTLPVLFLLAPPLHLVFPASPAPAAFGSFSAGGSAMQCFLPTPVWP